MPRDGVIIFGDLIGKLSELRIECPKCERARRHRLARPDHALRSCRAAMFVSPENIKLSR
jgi:hypothetical protein